MKNIKIARHVIADKKGDMGIGTMILFIAMVLVAAVAAALLISTAGELNQQAQETGRLTQQEVASGFIVVETVCVVDTSLTPDSITDVYMKIKLNAGSPAVDMDNVVLEVTGEDFHANLVYSTGTDLNNDYYNIMEPQHSSVPSSIIRDPDGKYGDPGDSSAPHIVTQGAMLMVHMDFDDTTDPIIDGGLLPQTQFSVKIIPKHGAATYEVINTPESYADAYIVLV